MQIRIVAISGSLRSGSSNTVLLRAARAIAPAGMIVDLYDGIDRLPFFNPDLDGDEVPPAVESFRSELRSSQGLLIACTRLGPLFAFRVHHVSTDRLGGPLIDARRRGGRQLADARP